MTGTSPPERISGTTSDFNISDAWGAIRAQDDIQFTPIQIIPQVKEPRSHHIRWLEKLLSDWAETLGVAVPWLQAIFITITLLVLAFIAWRFAAHFFKHWRLGKLKLQEDWSPQEGTVRALLEEADSLAERGQFTAAVHLLLYRSLEDISKERPDWVLPASTAREISAFALLSDRARHTFTIIAMLTERGIFAQRPLTRRDWLEARQAYSTFALQPLQSAQGAMMEAVA